MSCVAVENNYRVFLTRHPLTSTISKLQHIDISAYWKEYARFFFSLHFVDKAKKRWKTNRSHSSNCIPTQTHLILLFCMREHRHPFDLKMYSVLCRSSWIMIFTRVIRQGLAWLYRNGRANAVFFYFFTIYKYAYSSFFFSSEYLCFFSVPLLVYLQPGIRFELFQLQIFTFEGDQHLILFCCFLFGLFSF